MKSSLLQIAVAFGLPGSDPRWCNPTCGALAGTGRVLGPPAECDDMLSLTIFGVVALAIAVEVALAYVVHVLTERPGSSPHPGPWSDEAVDALRSLLLDAHDGVAGVAPPNGAC